MKTLAVLFLILCATLTLAPADAQAISGLRVKCDQPGAEVFLNGKRLGTCPGNFTTRAGSYTLTVKKPIDGDSEYLFRQEISLQDGEPMKIDATLQRTYTEAYQRRIREQQARAERERQERAALEEKNRRELSARISQYAAKADYVDTLTGMKFRPVPEGCFQMGDTFGDGYSIEKPVHEVCLSSAYRIGKYEVTQGQWQKIMGSNPSHFSSCGDNCPVEQVSWDDVQEFIRRLNSQTSKSYRLPTEAEWEYAARSGGKAEKYSGGDNPDAVAWYGGNSGDGTHPVGQKQANGLGLYDMSGNVWEWVSDWYGAYPSGRQQNPNVSLGGTDRVVRGGSWIHDPWLVRAARRYYFVPGLRNNFYLGFRLVSPVQ